MTLLTCDHEFGPDQPRTVTGGPLDGDWHIADCLHCNTFTLSAVGGDSLALVLARLTELGCEPHEITNEANR